MDDGRSEPWWLPWAAVILLAVLVGSLVDGREDHGWPAPIFAHFVEDEEPEPTVVGEGDVLGFRFEAPADAISGVSIAHRGGPVELALRNLTQDCLIAGGRVRYDGISRLVFEPANEGGDVLELTISGAVIPPPLLEEAGAWAWPGEVTVTVGEAVADGFVPLLDLGFNREEDVPEGYVPAATGTGTAPAIPILPGAPVRVEFDAPYADLTLAKVPRLIREVDHSVEIDIWNVTQGRLLKSSRERPGKRYWGSFKGGNEAGDRMAIILSADNTVAKVWRNGGESVPLEPLAESVAGSPPSVLLSYRFDLGWHLWWWLAAAAALLLALRLPAPPWAYVFTVLLAVAGITTGWIGWQLLTAEYGNYADPDGYQYYGEILGDALAGRMPVVDAASRISQYPHAYLPLTPVGIGLLTAVGVKAVYAYLWLVGLSNGVSLILFYRMLRWDLALPGRTALLGVAALGTHVAMIKMAGQPSPDAVGFLLTVLVVQLVIRRAKVAPSSGWRGDLWPVALILLHLLARPSGPIYAVFVALGIVAADAFRGGRFDWRQAVLVPLRLAIPCVLTLGLLFVVFGWWTNFKLAVALQENLGDFDSWPDFGECMLLLVQAWPLLWGAALVAWARGGRCRELGFPIATGAGWALYFPLGMVAAGAIFIPRLFVPMLPGTGLLTALALGWLGRRAPGAAAWLVTGVALANIGFALLAPFAMVWPGVTFGTVVLPVWEVLESGLVGE